MKNRSTELEHAVRELLGCISINEIMSNRFMVSVFESIEALFKKNTKEAAVMQSLEREIKRLVSAITPTEKETNPFLRNYIKNIESILLQIRIQSTMGRKIERKT